MLTTNIFSLIVVTACETNNTVNFSLPRFARILLVKFSLIWNKWPWIFLLKQQSPNLGRIFQPSFDRNSRPKTSTFTFCLLEFSVQAAKSFCFSMLSTNKAFLCEMVGQFGNKDMKYYFYTIYPFFVLIELSCYVITIIFIFQGFVNVNRNPWNVCRNILAESLN